jgi:hypothetical protein
MELLAYSVYDEQHPNEREANEYKWKLCSRAETVQRHTEKLKQATPGEKDYNCVQQ